MRASQLHDNLVALNTFGRGSGTAVFTELPADTYLLNIRIGGGPMSVLVWSAKAYLLCCHCLLHCIAQHRSSLRLCINWPVTVHDCIAFHCQIIYVLYTLYIVVDYDIYNSLQNGASLQYDTQPQMRQTLTALQAYLGKVACRSSI